MATWTLRDRGRDLAVRDDGDGGLVLSLDGVEVDEATVGRLGDHEFELDRIAGRHQKVKTERGVGAALSKVVLVESGNGDLPVTVPFVPPEGTHARRLHDLREAHPKAWAARHVVFTVVGLLGIGALVSAFLSRLVPAIDWSWLPDAPDVNLPGLGFELSFPSWLRYLNPFYWLGRITPDWLADLPWGVIISLLVACSLAWGEYRKQQDRKEREERTDD